MSGDHCDGGVRRRGTGANGPFDPGSPQLCLGTGVAGQAPTAGHGGARRAGARDGPAALNGFTRRRVWRAATRHRESQEAG
jgi:hypothetical protein